MATVVLTRKGQTTIPKELREKYGLNEGAKLDVIDTGDRRPTEKAVSTADLIGSSSRTYEEMKRELDKVRREDA